MSDELSVMNETAPVAKSATTEMVSSRATQEIQGQMVLAKKFPRNELSSIQRIKNACKRPKLAENATYEYKRGTTKIKAPSIRLAECIAQNWGNINFGVIELEQRHGQSVVMSYALDLETNTRQEKIFTVKHERVKNEYIDGKKVPKVTIITDERDIYEMVANKGARRLRACILGVIPGDVADEAVEICELTLKGKSDVPLVDRLRKMLTAFEPYGVTQDAIEYKLGHNLDATSEGEFVTLTGNFNSLKDGVAKREEIFPMPVSEPNVDAFEGLAEAPKKTAKKAPKK